MGFLFKLRGFYVAGKNVIFIDFEPAVKDSAEFWKAALPAGSGYDEPVVRVDFIAELWHNLNILLHFGMSETTAERQ